MGHLECLFLVEVALRLFDQGQHIAHPQNTGGHAVGIEWFQLIELFASTHKLDRPARDHTHRKCCTAAGITVELGEDHPIDPQCFIEFFRHIDCILANHRIDYQQDFMRLNGGFDRLQLAHQRLVDMQPPGGIEDHQVVPVVLGVQHCPPRNLNRVILPHFKHRDACPLTDHFQRVNRRRTIDVARNKQRAFALSLEMECEFCRMGCLTGTLQSTHHYNRRGLALEVQTGIAFPHQGSQLVIDDLNDHLCRGEALKHLVADRLGSHICDKLFGYLVVDVRFEQRKPHFPHCFLDVALLQFPFVPHPLEYGGKLVRKPFKRHKACPFPV